MPLLMCDLDDTLVERPPLFRVWAEAFLAEHGAAPDLVDWVIERDRGGHRPRDQFLTEVAARVGYDAPYEQLLAEYDEPFGSSYRLVDEVRAALDDVRAAGWSFAVVTNGPTTVQTRKVRAAGLDKLADAVCISDEVGAAKPDPLVFRTAAARAGTTLEGAWMIGDNLDADIAGGLGVGARTAWVKREYDWLTYSSGVEPDLVAIDFPDAVRRLLAS
jgi:FMN phosphatase YigB (HAD superfamily)